VHTAYHEPIFVKLAKAVIVQGTHNAGPKALSQEGLTLCDVFPGFIYKLPLLFIRMGFHPLPKICPFYVGMVLEITVAAIVRTSVAGEADLPGYVVVLLFHPDIKEGQLFKQMVLHSSWFSRFRTVSYLPL